MLKAQFRRMGPKYESTSGSDQMRDLFARIGEEIAFRHFFEEYEIDWNLPALPEAEKESFRQHPEAYLRKMLAENDFDPINSVGVNGDPEACLKARGDVAAAAVTLWHIRYGPMRSSYVVG
jgi:hypothetical protein